MGSTEASADQSRPWKSREATPALSEPANSSRREILFAKGMILVSRVKKDLYSRAQYTPGRSCATGCIPRPDDACHGLRPHIRADDCRAVNYGRHHGWRIQRNGRPAMPSTAEIGGKKSAEKRLPRVRAMAGQEGIQDRRHPDAILGALTGMFPIFAWWLEFGDACPLCDPYRRGV